MNKIVFDFPVFICVIFFFASSENGALYTSSPPQNNKETKTKIAYIYQE